MQLQLIATEKAVTQNRHHRETVMADTRKAAEKQQQEYGLMARRRRLTIYPIELPPPNKDERHQNLLQQILKYEAIFESLKLATQSHDKDVSLQTPCCSIYAVLRRHNRRVYLRHMKEFDTYYKIPKQSLNFWDSRARINCDGVSKG